MLPGLYDLQLYRGDTTRLRFRLWQDQAKTVPTDLTAATAIAQIRDRPDAASIVTEIACTIALPNTIDLQVPAQGAANLRYRGVWDLQLTWASGDITTVVYGDAVTAPDVTRPSA